MRNLKINSKANVFVTEVFIVKERFRLVTQIFNRKF